MMIDFSAIPAQMQAENAWLLWHRYSHQDGTIKKIPDEFSRYKRNWETIRLLSFPAAKAALYSPQSLSDGLGIAFTKNNVLAGIDIDDAILQDGGYNESVRAIILPILKQARQDGCYIEKSISGTGYHIYGYTTIKPLLMATGNGKIVSENVEIYLANSYFVVSGNMCSPGWGNLDNSIRIAYQIIKGKPLPDVPSTAQNKPATTPTNTQDDTTPVPATKPPTTINKTAYNGYSDEEVLKLPLATVNTVLYIMGKDTKKHGAEAAEAMQNGYPADVNKSEYDEKIIGVLVYWLYRFGEDTVCDIFKRSRLYRPHDAADKTERKARLYVENSVSKAFQNAEKFFPAADYKKLSDAQKDKLKAWIKQKERE